MGNSLPELLGLAPLRVHVVRVEVAGLPGMEHDVGFGDRPPQRPPLGAELVLLEVALLDHRSSPTRVMGVGEDDGCAAPSSNTQHPSPHRAAVGLSLSSLAAVHLRIYDDAPANDGGKRTAP